MRGRPDWHHEAKMHARLVDALDTRRPVTICITDHSWKVHGIVAAVAETGEYTISTPKGDVLGHVRHADSVRVERVTA